MIKNQPLINKLRTYANQANITNAPGVFFASLWDYVKLILTNPAFTQSLKVIMDKGEAAKNLLDTIAAAGLDELKSKHIILRNYATKQTTLNPLVMQALDSFQSQLNKSTQLNRMLFTHLDHALNALLNDNQADHSDFTQTFGKINRINDYKFIHIEDAFPKFHAWEQASQYYAQAKETADWYSLNQLMVFAERYDLYLYDKLLKELIKNGLDVSNLQREHTALLAYAYNGIPPTNNLLPIIEEYKCHVMRLTESIVEILISLDVQTEVKIYACIYNIDTAELLVTDKLPIKFESNLKPAEFLAKITSAKKMPLSFKTIFNDLKLYTDGKRVKGDLSASENKIVRNLIKNINNRFALVGLPNFLIIQDAKGSLTQKTVLISASYKLI